MILNVVIKDVDKCIKKFQDYSKLDPSAQLFISSDYKCARHRSVVGVVFSNHRIGNGRVISEQNLTVFADVESLNEKEVAFLQKVVVDETIHPITQV